MQAFQAAAAEKTAKYGRVIAGVNDVHTDKPVPHLRKSFLGHTKKKTNYGAVARSLASQSVFASEDHTAIITPDHEDDEDNRHLRCYTQETAK